MYWSLPLAIFLTSFAACEGCDPPLAVIAPQIAVDVCKDPPLEVRGELLGGIRDCEFDFGDVPISTRATKELRISNPSPASLIIEPPNSEAVAFVGASDPAYRVEVVPSDIGPGLNAGLGVSVRPLVEGAIEGTLLISSDAENLAEGENVLVNFTANGIDDGVPELVVDPLRCDFGRVAQNGIAECDLAVRNEGTRDLIMEGVTLLEEALQVPSGSNIEEPFGFIGRLPTEGDAIAAGGEISIKLRFTPDALGRFQSTLRLLSNDPAQPTLDLPVLGLGVEPPICDALVVTVNGVEVEVDRLPQIEPLDDVRISAAPSSPSTPDGTIASVRWSIIQQPPGSTALLSTPEGVDTGFFFAGSVTGIDLAGRYAVRAVVVDDLGTESVNECTVEFEAIPTDTILTQLSWDAPYGDMDLHFIRKVDGQFCSNFDGEFSSSSCGNEATYYGNRNPDWDGLPGTEGDPSLDIDDLCGFGPENINIDIALPGEYLVGVDFFGFTGCSGQGVVGNTLQIYLFGQLQAEFFRDLDSGDWWEVAIIYWNGVDGDPPCIEDLGTAELECPQGGE